MFHSNVRLALQWSTRTFTRSQYHGKNRPLTARRQSNRQSSLDHAARLPRLGLGRDHENGQALVRVDRHPISKAGMETAIRRMDAVERTVYPARTRGRRLGHTIRDYRGQQVVRERVMGRAVPAWTNHLRRRCGSSTSPNQRSGKQHLHSRLLQSMLEIGIRSER